MMGAYALEFKTLDDHTWSVDDYYSTLESALLALAQVASLDVRYEHRIIKKFSREVVRLPALEEFKP